MFKIFKYFKFIQSHSKIQEPEKSNLKSNIDFKILAPDVYNSEINMVLVIFSDEQNNFKSIYNVPSLIFINFGNIDLNNQKVFLIFAKNPADTSIKILVDNNEVDVCKTKFIINVLPFNLLDNYFNRIIIKSEV